METYYTIRYKIPGSRRYTLLPGRDASVQAAIESLRRHTLWAQGVRYVVDQHRADGGHVAGVFGGTL